MVPPNPILYLTILPFSMHSGTAAQRHLIHFIAFLEHAERGITTDADGDWGFERFLTSDHCSFSGMAGESGEEMFIPAVGRGRGERGKESARSGQFRCLVKLCVSRSEGSRSAAKTSRAIEWERESGGGRDRERERERERQKAPSDSDDRVQDAQYDLTVSKVFAILEGGGDQVVWELGTRGV